MEPIENPKEIKNVQALDDLKLKITFEDGDRIVDMITFNLLGIFKKITKNKQLFNTVHLDDGVVTWDGDLMLENNDLYYHGILANKNKLLNYKKFYKSLFNNTPLNEKNICYH